ncbi:hypothetical protein DFQ30_001415 [Apophysomyces sp. BC1015]|nr:hypothetical protein DFQ30_001415 [Apophysomyces sp. BC1015]
MSLFGLLGVLLYTLQTRFSFCGAKPLLCSIVAICLSSPWLRYVFDMDPIQILWPMFLSCLVCIYLILDLYYVMGAVVPEDYILANVCFYVDLAYPVRCLHHCCELSDGLDASDILSPERSAPLDRR